MSSKSKRMFVKSAKPPLVRDPNTTWPIRREYNIRKNALCPCGTGLTFKRCHGKPVYPQPQEEYHPPVRRDPSILEESAPITTES